MLEGWGHGPAYEGSTSSFFPLPTTFPLSLCAALTPGRDYADTVDGEILYMHLEIKIWSFCQYFCQAMEINVAKICVSMYVAEAQPNARLFSKTEGHISISIFLSASSIDIFLFITET